MALVMAEGYGPGSTGAAKTKIWRAQVTADGSGDWSADYTSAGFAGTPIVSATAQNNTGTLIDQAWAHVAGANSTVATGTAIRGSLVLGLSDPSVRTAPGVSVNVIAVGV